VKRETIILDLLKDEVERTIQKLQSKVFVPDPIAGPHFSKITSLMSSAYKRHGYILERAVLEALKQCERFEVWRDDHFQVTSGTDHIVDTTIATPTELIGKDFPYSEAGDRSLQVDAIVYDKTTKIIRAYEIKRGAGLHDSGKRRSMLRDILCVQILLKDYGRKRGYDVEQAFSHIIFYYGQCSIPKPFSLTGAEMNEHFGWPVYEAVEEVNQHFKARLFAILSGG
jgi:hypothetical protein